MNPYLRAEAVFLLLDAAKKKSGAAITRPGGSAGLSLVTGAIVRCQADRETFVVSAKELATAHNLPLIVVAEEWDPPRGAGEKRVDKRWNYPTILGIGEGWGRWTAEFERHAVSELDVVRVTPNVWRDALFGPQRPRDSVELKRFAVRYIQTRLHATLPEDVAEAVCIGLWGLHSPDVHRRIETWRYKKGLRRSS